MKYLLIILLPITACSQDKLYFNGPTVAVTGPDRLTTPDTLYYYILAGQSNMSGRANVVNFSPPYSGKIKTATHAVFIKNYQTNPGSFDTLETNVNCSDMTNLAGIQPNLGYDLCDYKNKDIYLIQSALGGQAIGEWASSEPLGAWLDSSITLVQERAEDEGKEVLFKAMIWCQGESAGAFDTAAWHSSLSGIIARVRSLSNTPALPCYIIQMKDCQTGISGGAPGLVALQAVQADVAAEPNNHLVGKDDTPPNTCADSVHFDYATYVSIADFIFNLIKDL